MTVTLRVWRIEAGRIPVAFWSMAAQRGRMRRAPGVRFAKLFGTARGSEFGPAAADLTRWAALTVSDGPAPQPALARYAVGQCTLTLETITSRGAWSGRDPFGPGTPGSRREAESRREAGLGRGVGVGGGVGVDGAGALGEGGGEGSGRTGGRVLVLTRARLRVARAVPFWRAIGAVGAGVREQPGLLAAFGFGEAPIGFQGTVSVWADAADIVRFAYRQPEHAAVVARTPRERWYAEELFARFRVRGIDGDREVIGWRGDA